MRELVEKLTGRGEFILITSICFSYAIVSSVLVLLLGVRRFELTTGRVLRGVVVEIVILAMVASILRLRGWRLDRLGLRFSWGDLPIGVLLFIGYMLFYWATAFAVASLFPSARNVKAFSFTPKAPFLLVVLFIVINSAFEEISVTAYVVEALSNQGEALAISASTLIRFSYHLYQGPVACISILPLGLLFGAVYWRGRRLWPLMVAHTIANLIAFGLAAARAKN